MRFQIIRSLYPKNVPRFRHSSSLKWCPARHIHLASTFFSCLDTRKEGKRKSRPLPRPGKMAEYMMEIENVMRFGIIWLLYLKSAIRFAHLPSSGWHPVGAYAIRPYPDARKIVAPQPCYLVGSKKRAAFRTCYLVGSEKRAAFGTCYLVEGAKRAAFRTCY